MMSDFRSIQPQLYFQQCLEQKQTRPDGRKLNQTRPVALTIGSLNTADGSAVVKIGNTTIICGVKAEICAPKEESPDDGFVIPNVELPPLCSSKFKPGPPSEQAQITNQLMLELLENSKMINLQDLSIKKGKYVWILYVDMICLDYDGNLIDACVMAMVTALKDTEIPKATWSEKNGLQVVQKSKKSLTILNLPVSTSFCIFNEQILIDPTREEEQLSTGSMSIVINSDDSLCSLHKPGGSPLHPDKIITCIMEARNMTQVTRKLYEETRKLK